MEVNDLFYILRSRTVSPQINVNCGIEDCLDKILNRNLNAEHVYFRNTHNKELARYRIVDSFLGETLEQVVTRIENEYPANVSIIANEEDGFDLYLEYLYREEINGRFDT